jgi:D-alanyl-D-alanine carboxypeptidase
MRHVNITKRSEGHVDRLENGLELKRKGFADLQRQHAGIRYFGHYRMKRTIVLALMLAGFVLALPAATAAQLPQVDALVEQFMKQEGVVGAAVAVMKHQDVLHAKGYGYADLEKGVKATEETVFRIASLTKQFTATSMMILQNQGKVKLEDDVTKYFPDFPSKGQHITIEHLLNHTSGMSFEDAWTEAAARADVDVNALRDLSAPLLTRLFAGIRFEFAPGERFRYNNNAYQFAGLLIERVSGLSFAAFLQKHIWDPLGMSQTYYLDTSRIIQHRAAGYTKRNDMVINAPPYNMAAAYSAGAIGSTVLDLMKWQRALLNNRLLSAADLTKMTTPVRLKDGPPGPYGLGLFLLEMEGKRKVEHYGNIGGFRAQLAHYPEADLTVTVLANTNPARTEVLESRIARALMNIPEAQITEVAVPKDRLRRYAGDYVVSDALVSHRSGTTQIVFKDDALYAGSFRLHAIGQDVFVPTADPYHRYTFIMNNGVPVGLRVEREGRLIADARRKS